MVTPIKILLLSTAAVIGIGGTSAALTKDQWWPKKENKDSVKASDVGVKEVLDAEPECQGESRDCQKEQNTDGDS